MSREYLCNSSNWKMYSLWMGNLLSQIDYGEKSAKELFVELKEGESKLFKENNRIFREVELVKLKILHPYIKNKILVEAAQFLPQKGIWRHRNILPSEKLLPLESPQQAAIRGLEEELGFISNYKLSSSPQLCETKPSKSYNKLQTTYLIFPFTVHIENALFQEEYKQREKDGKISIFHWQEFYG